MDECIHILDQENRSCRLYIFNSFSDSFDKAVKKLKNKSCKNKLRQSLLHLSVLWNNVEAIDILLKYGLDYLNDKDIFDQTPYDYAIKNQNKDILKRFVLGNDINKIKYLEKEKKSLKNDNNVLNTLLCKEQGKRKYAESRINYMENELNLEKSNKNSEYKKKYETELSKNENLKMCNANLSRDNNILKMRVNSLEFNIDELSTKKAKTEKELKETKEERDVLKKRWDNHGRDKFRK